MTAYFNRSALLLIVPCLFLAATASAQVAEFTGKAIAVIDGDTIDVMSLGKSERVRLYGVDAPEIDQAFGTKAQRFTSEQVFGKNVRVVVRDTDFFGRTIGDVYLSNGKRLNEILVSAGMAWWYSQYAPDDTKLMRRQLDASSKKLGLWADDLPVAPWDFREGVGSTTKQATSTRTHFGFFKGVPQPAPKAPAPAQRVQPQPTKETLPQVQP